MHELYLGTHSLAENVEKRKLIFDFPAKVRRTLDGAARCSGESYPQSIKTAI